MVAMVNPHTSTFSISFSPRHPSVSLTKLNRYKRSRTHFRIWVILQGTATELHVREPLPRPLVLLHLPLVAVGHVLLVLGDFLRRVDAGVLLLDLIEG